MIMLKRKYWDDDADEELTLFRPVEPFEVDGITYIPPWHLSTHYPTQPICQLKDDMDLGFRGQDIMPLETDPFVIDDYDPVDEGD